MIHQKHSAVNSSDSLTYSHISNATNEALEFIDKRRKHEIESLKTRWNGFNNVCMGGIECNVVYTIAGISGAGKSAFVNMIETDLIDLNPDKEVVILSFSFEMLSYRQVGRKLSHKLKKTVSELYSAHQDLSDDQFEIVKNAAKRIRNYSIYYVETPGTVEQIENTIYQFYENVAEGKYFVIVLDHNLLVNRAGQTILETISDLQKVFIKVKKLPLTTIIQLSQMNRNIEAPERINNPFNHFPQRSDLSSADSIYQASDYVFAIHRPEILGIVAYGSERLVVKNKVYLHLLKIRDGEGKSLVFNNDLKHGNLIETMIEYLQ